MKTVLTTCPFCACGCAVYLQAQDGRLAGVLPSEHHPVSRGKLCARCWGAHEAPVWGRRLTTAAIRRNGALKPASFGEAVGHAVSRLSSLVAAGKRVGVLGSPRATNEENYLVAKLAGAALGTPNLDSCLRASCEPLLAGIEQVVGRFSPSATLDDVERSELVLVVGQDVCSTHPRAAFAVMKAVGNGAKLVTLGSARTQIGRLATLHLAAAPGAEGEVINGLMAALVGTGPEDRGRASEGFEGYEPLRRRLQSVQVEDDVRTAAEWIARAERAVVMLAPTGMMPDKARKQAAALATLAGMAGWLDRPGAGLLPLVGRSNFIGSRDMGVSPDRLPVCEQRADRRAQDNVKALWGKPPASETGLDAEAMLDSVSGLVVVADDPSVSLPGKKRALAAMGKLECLVVIDAFDTSAAQLAHVVLPMASYAESEGTYTNMEGRVQRVRAAADPPGEAKQGWEVLRDLVAKFNCSATYGSSADVFREIALAGAPYAGMAHDALDRGWGQMTAKVQDGRKGALSAAEGEKLTSGDYPLTLVVDGVLDWGSDPLVSFSPTLSRDSVSRRKLYPEGVVQMAPKDAETLGIRHGWKVKIVSAHGETIVPVALRADLGQGVLLVPFSFRDCVEGVLGGKGLAAARVERT